MHKRPCGSLRRPENPSQPSLCSSGGGRATWASSTQTEQRPPAGKAPSSRSDAVMDYYCRRPWGADVGTVRAAAESRVRSERAPWHKRTQFPFSLFPLCTDFVTGRASPLTGCSQLPSSAAKSQTKRKGILEGKRRRGTGPPPNKHAGTSALDKTGAESEEKRLSTLGKRPPLWVRPGWAHQLPMNLVLADPR